MKLGFLNDQSSLETRSTLDLVSAKKLISKGIDVFVEKSFSKELFSDDDFVQIGVTIKERYDILKSSDFIVQLSPLNEDEIKVMKKGAIFYGFLNPFFNRPLLTTFSKFGIKAISMEMIPRTTIAQKMDILSSQANLAGYVAVMVAAERIKKVLPMMITPAGTISPCRVFVIGVGVAGLQAIATAKRLGARVEAFDTRPVVEEQVKSLGAKFIKVDLGATGETQDGYAKELSAEKLKKQKEVMAKQCQLCDIVITTAQVFGRRAPRIVTKDMVLNMSRGSVIVDLAVDSGGNVEGAELGKEILINGVNVIGLANFPGHVAVHASQVLSANIFNFIDEFWDSENKIFQFDMSNEILSSSVITNDGEIVNKMFLE
ncbi:NAD(P)(+) transhydrogenase (Re/Si-specific) subunit alpha [Candidatus Marinamargulisbacteria bacterium SCGC AG-410-N11]|nr:NAD(P)(+) transhydrogenase (Re/Si-specific) subunit alpha [Candidatus Marinamargulisbacteria bacterium SCGC AG-410-N11]